MQPQNALDVIERIIGEEQEYDVLVRKIKNIINSSDILSLKTVSGIVNYNFVIPDYQRGYRWKKQQVEDLLKDIDAFDSENEEFYCLQPIVVKRNPDGGYELIDGQQRLTTIFIILKYLNPAEGMSELKYQTKEKSATNFLENIWYYQDRDWESIITENPDLNNVDNWHFHSASQAVNNWFCGKSDEDKEKWRRKLLKHSKVIWYKIIPADDNPENTSIKIFQKLNTGKIPLTNAELIKAWFLHNHPEKNQEIKHLRQLEIAGEWDRIEYTLQDDEFWHFINVNAHKDKRPNRIEFIFDLLQKKPAKKLDDEFYTYNKYGSKNDADIEKEWSEVVECFTRLKEWFEDDQSYHLIGFIIIRRIDRIEKILEESMTKTKNEFQDFLKRKICDRFKEYDIDKLSYGSDNGKLHDVLLLFNLKIIDLSGCSVRFSFKKFNKAQWSLEHIHARNSRELTGGEEAEIWYKEMLTLNIDGLRERVEAWWWLYDDDIASGDAEKERAGIENDFKLWTDEDTDTKHDICNLALLPKDANSSLNNAIFQIKRQRVNEYEKKGGFVPLGTQRVFSKYYTDEVGDMLKWGNKDREAYKQAIKEALSEYLPNQGGE